MAIYRADLPQLTDGVFLTDSGLETDLIFHHGYELPQFAAFVLLEDEGGIDRLERYYREHAAIAADVGAGFIFESATWRASPDWGERLGYTLDRLAEVNRKAIAMLVEIRAELGNQARPMVVSGCIGPRHDGYHPSELMTPGQAQRYHSMQAATFAGTDADLVTAMTITYPAEAIGIARAAADVEVPAVISFTVETEGDLPDGTPLRDAIEAVDEETGGFPAYYMVNCAHPTHFQHVLEPGATWTERIRGMRANASRQSHAELDEAEELDDGDPAELASQYEGLRASLPGLTVLGGCCGTDGRHIREIAMACVRA